MAVPGGLCSAYRFFVSHLIELTELSIYESSASLCHLRPLLLVYLLYFEARFTHHQCQIDGCATEWGASCQ